MSKQQRITDLEQRTGHLEEVYENLLTRSASFQEMYDEITTRQSYIEKMLDNNAVAIASVRELCNTLQENLENKTLQIESLQKLCDALLREINSLVPSPFVPKAGGVMQPTMMDDKLLKKVFPPVNPSPVFDSRPGAGDCKITWTEPDKLEQQTGPKLDKKTVADSEYVKDVERIKAIVTDRCLTYELNSESPADKTMAYFDPTKAEIFDRFLLAQINLIERSENNRYWGVHCWCGVQHFKTFYHKHLCSALVTCFNAIVADITTNGINENSITRFTATKGRI